ncbi:hypothetical protein M2152_001032 [Microbacteriaceae bacterium SG_E_30_P1]|uniref:Uncharacterized protein n=1 Tax=Antiquaquibacter oligotrophicus TaxID=2880260 RepID=A0ABT6KM97_9MICO|nr:hypothetical protein [Antiquaquibacter oligotrophicus]MDH6180850.1 hypothetical protein [Antiquaquibacter oligotrophicus]UDF13436.1 hypothetical protein LH407_00830 [Antiquaquibacter oligotrophicus]
MSDIINNYVADVVRRIPRSQRDDVAFELKELISDELRGRAEEAGGVVDDATTIAFLTAFGRPADVADRYRPAGFTIIRPSDAPRFAAVALGGVAVQWVLTLVATFSTPTPGVEWLSLLGAWWLSWGLGALWWPGLLVSLSIVAALVGTRRTAAPAVSTKEVDRARVSRAGIVLTLVGGVVGATVVISLPLLPSWGSGLPDPVIAAFAFDQDFLVLRAPWVLLIWAASAALGIALIAAGRWTRSLTWAAIGLDIAWIVLLTLWVIAPIFISPLADSTTRSILVLLMAVVVVDLVLRVRALPRRPRTPRVSVRP